MCVCVCVCVCVTFLAQTGATSVCVVLLDRSHCAAITSSLQGQCGTALLQQLYNANGVLRGRRVILPAYGAGPYLPAIVLERPVYIREMHDGLYSPATYLAYKVRSDALSSTAQY